MNKIKDFFRVVKSEIISSGLILVISISIALAFLSIIGLLIPGNIAEDAQKVAAAGAIDNLNIQDVIRDPSSINLGEISVQIEEKIREFSRARVIQSVAQISTFSFIAVLVQALRDRSSLDKNRISFLNYGKNQVTIAKVLVQTLRYILPIIFVSIIAPFLVVYNIGGTLDPVQTFKEIFLFIISMTAFFLLVIFVLLWLNSKEWEKPIKWLIISTWLVLSVGVNIVFGIVIPLVDEVGNFFGNEINQIWISILPFFNFTTAYASIQGKMELWTISPLIFEVIIFVSIFWNKFSFSLKQYLCT